MTLKAKLQVAWDVDLPSPGFADRVVARAFALDETNRCGEPHSRIIPIAALRGSPSAIDGKRYRSFAIAAAAAAFVLYLGALPAARDGDSRLLQPIDRERPEELVPMRIAQDSIGRSVTNGGNTASNPEAGAGVW